MITSLPLLPSTYGQWDWSKSNGAATDIQTQSSYQTLLDKGLCSNFSRFVWNDIVDSTANALQAAGIEWDSAYGSIEDCKITEFLGALLADKFNGVAININRLGLFYWKWSVIHGIDGYVGRDDFCGISTHGRNADDIYAWYIIELTKKLNWFIEVLKDEADFSEFIDNESLFSHNNSKLSSIITVPSRAYSKNTSCELAKVHQIGVLRNKSYVFEQSHNNGILLPTNKNILLLPNANSASNVDAVSRTLFTCSLYGAQIDTNTIHNAVLHDLSHVRYLRHDERIKSNITAVMEANIQDMLASLYSIGECVSKLTPSPTLFLTSQSYFESICNPILTVADESLLNVLHESKTVYNTILSDLSSFGLLVTNNSKSLSNSEIILKRICALRAIMPIAAITDGIISTPGAVSFTSGNKSITNIAANGKTSIAKSVRFIDKSCFYLKDSMCASKSASTQVIQYSDAQIDAVIRSARVVRGASFLSSNSNYITPNLKPCTCCKTSSQNSSNSCANGIIEKGIPRHIDADVHDCSYVESIIQPANVKLVNSNGQSITVLSTQIGCCMPEKISTSVQNDSYTKSNLSFVNGRTSSTIKAYSFSISVLENGAEPEDDWLDPIRTDNNLYIRQVYNPWRKAETAYLDAELWFAPIRTGDNLYIRSEGSMEVI